MRSVLIKESHLIIWLWFNLEYIHTMIHTCRFDRRMGKNVLPVSHWSREMVLYEVDGGLYPPFDRPD